MDKVLLYINCNFWKIICIYFPPAADALIDESLCGVRAYCKRENPENCFHAEVEYDEQFHKDDKVRALNHTDNFVIPSPGTALLVGDF